MILLIRKLAPGRLARAILALGFRPGNRAPVIDHEVLRGFNPQPDSPE